MKLINDALSSAGFFVSGLLKIVNEYAWQSYAEKTKLTRTLTNLMYISNCMSRSGENVVNPTMLLGGVLARYGRQDQSFLFTNYYPGYCLVDYLIHTFQLRLSEHPDGYIAFINQKTKTILLIDNLDELFQKFVPDEDPRQWRIFAFGFDFVNDAELLAKKNFKKIKLI